MARCRKCRLQSSKDATPFLASPADSGYGSFESSPEASPQLKTRDFIVFDGTSSHDAADSSTDGTELDSPCPRARPRFRSTSAPCQDKGNKRTSHFPVVLFDYRSSSPASPSKRPLCQTQLSDRYVPRRDPTLSPAEKYRTAKQAQDLTPSERILRNSHASLDPFAVRVAATVAPIRRAVPPSDARHLNLGLSWQWYHTSRRKANPDFFSGYRTQLIASKSCSCQANKPRHGVDGRRSSPEHGCHRRWSGALDSTRHQRPYLQCYLLCCKAEYSRRNR